MRPFYMVQTYMVPIQTTGAVIDIGKLGRSDFEIAFQWADIQALVDKFHHAGHREATRLLRGKELLELVEKFQRA